MFTEVPFVKFKKPENPKYPSNGVDEQTTVLLSI